MQMIGAQKVHSFKDNVTESLKAVLKSEGTLTNQDVLTGISIILKRTRKRCPTGELVKFFDVSQKS